MYRPQNRTTASTRMDCLCIHSGPERYIISDIGSFAKQTAATITTDTTATTHNEIFR
jgi:hypothetical protein